MQSHRNKLLAAIHIGREHLKMAEEDYRALIWGIGHVESAKDLSIDGLTKVLDRLRSLGAGRKAFVPATAHQRMVWKLWQSLRRLGLIGGGDPALDRWLSRTCGVDALRFLLKPADINKAIEGLKAMAARAGFVPPDDATVKRFNAWRAGAGLPKATPGAVATMLLIEAQWRRLDALGAFTRSGGGSGRLETWLRPRGRCAAVQFIADAALADTLAEELATWIARLRPAEGGE